MSLPSEDSLKGYILEEVLAYLLRTAGYELLVKKEQDSRELDRRGAGLVVKGRGGEHQVDVLGELKWIPAFTFPLRLVIEAKFRGNTTGIGVVRDSVSASQDINQKYAPVEEAIEKSIPRYNYEFAIFSTSGFSEYAFNMAFAHKISLIDLSGDEYQDIKNAIVQGARSIINSVSYPNGTNRKKLVSDVRYVLRTGLRTVPEGVQTSPHNEDRIGLLQDSLRGVVNAAKEYDKLFVGMANGPFLLLLKAGDPDRFLSYAKRRPTHDVRINWSTQRSGGREWTIQPMDERGGYELTFRLPEPLYKWIFGVEKDKKTRMRAIHAKREHFSSISVYHKEEEGEPGSYPKDHIFRLRFDPDSVVGNRTLTLNGR